MRVSEFIKRLEELAEQCKSDDPHVVVQVNHKGRGVLFKLASAECENVAPCDNSMTRFRDKYEGNTIQVVKVW